MKEASARGPVRPRRVERADGGKADYVRANLLEELPDRNLAANWRGSLDVCPLGHGVYAQNFTEVGVAW